jgi:hypothetical protein
MPATPPHSCTSSAEPGAWRPSTARCACCRVPRGRPLLSLASSPRARGLVKSTTLRLLASLTHFGCVQRLPDGRYALGPRSHGCSRSTPLLLARERGHAGMRELVRRTRESGVYHVRQGEARLVPLSRGLAAADPRPRAGGRPGAAGSRRRGTRAIGVFGREGTIYDRIRRRATRRSSATARRLAGIAAPVFKAGGELGGAVTLTMPARRFRKDHVEPVRERPRDQREAGVPSLGRGRGPIRNRRGRSSARTPVGKDRWLRSVRGS